MSVFFKNKVTFIYKKGYLLYLDILVEDVQQSCFDIDNKYAKYATWCWLVDGILLLAQNPKKEMLR